MAPETRHKTLIPDFPPLFPTGNWWKIRLSALMEGIPDDTAILKANEAYAASAGSVTKARRNWMRFTISSRNGTPVTLSIPVNGSASALKNHTPDGWELSDHGDIRRTLPHTLSTEYNHTPFYRYIAPALPIFTDDSEEVLCSALCRRLDRAVMHILGLDDSIETLSTLQSAVANKSFILGTRKEELLNKADLSISIFDTLMRLGPETLILIT